MIAKIFIIALVVNGVNISTWHNMVFGKVGAWAQKQATENPKLYMMLKPLFVCVWCMPPLWSIGINYLLQGYPLFESLIIGIAAIPIAGYIAAKIETA